MKARWISGAALAATLALTGAAHASDSTTPRSTVSAFALASPALDLAPTAALVGSGAEPSPATVAFTSGPSLEAVRYRPRRGHGRRVPSTSVSQFHGGFFDPDNGSSSGVLIGFRAGTEFDSRVAVTAGLDWRFKEERSSEVVSEEPIPGGGTREVRRELSRSSSHWIPIMLGLHVSPTGDELGVVPYFGVSGGYQLMFLSAEDFQSGEDFEGTFGGWGWQLYGGVGVPLSGRTRLTAEVFMNDADLDREVEDALTGQVFREAVNMDGIGVRAGFAWGF